MISRLTDNGSNLSAKVKTALDESRTLILGAQILLGFQFHSVFQERFDALADEDRILSAVALALMFASVATLITPSVFHRLAERGASTSRIKNITGRLAAIALLPFALTLGIDLDITLNQAFSSGWIAKVSGGLFMALAVSGWYGVGTLMKRKYGAVERTTAVAEGDCRESAPLHSRIEQMLTEARVILPGAQALLGFQLVIVLTSTFEKLPPSLRAAHGMALLCVALAVVLLITPAALHRIVWAGEDSDDLLRYGGRITVLALIPLAVGMSADAHVVFALIFRSPAWGMALAIVLGLALATLWFAWPMLARRSYR